MEKFIKPSKFAGLILTPISFTGLVVCVVIIILDTKDVCPPGPMGDLCMNLYFSTEGRKYFVLSIIFSITLTVGLLLIGTWALLWFLSRKQQQAMQTTGTIAFSDPQTNQGQATVQATPAADIQPGQVPTPANVGAPPFQPPQDAAAQAHSIFCADCGTEAEIDQQFCIECGQGLETVT